MLSKVKCFSKTQHPKDVAIIAEKCNVTLEFGKNHLPKFETGKDPDDALRDLCEAGLKEKYSKEQQKEAKERLDYELSVLKQMGFATYFLIVHDFVSESKKRGIPVGPGRGSAAGSIISYTLGITTIEPLKYGLLFERFFIKILRFSTSSMLPSQLIFLLFRIWLSLSIL